jgi:hypothetical protein
LYNNILAGLPDFSWYNTHNREKYTKMNTKYTNWPQNIRNCSKIDQNGHKMYQHLSLKDTQKFTRSGIFGLKIYHLATLHFGRVAENHFSCHKALSNKVKHYVQTLQQTM